jgi:hypothetical protein
LTTKQKKEGIKMKRIASGMTLTLLLLLTFTFSPSRAYTTQGIPATVDVDPDALNLMSEGKWITASIELPIGYNVGDVDVSTIMLNDTIPVDLEGSVEVGDYDNDSIPDLMVVFNRAMLVEFMVSKGVSHGNVTLALSGNLRDRWKTRFIGYCVMPVSALAGDVNCDGIVDIYDVVVAASSYNATEGEPNWNPNANVAPSYDRIDIFDLVTITYHYGETIP